MIGNKLFDYEITRKIKAGGMGVVYEARRVWGKRERVAIKFLLEQLRDDDNIRRRFIREAEILEMLTHPGIVKILGLDPDRDAFVMEFVEGKTLAEQLRSTPQMYHQPQVAVEMFAKLLDAFDYAHHVVIEIGARREQGVIHRDIKPSNIIIEPNGNPKILDFGISRISTFESTLTDPKLQMGSIAYMSPEQIVNPAGVDWRSDIYALGVNLWELFAARSPYPQVTNFDMVIQVQNSIRNEPLPLLADTQEEVDNDYRAFLERVDKVIATATAKEPGLRYQRCGQMREALLATLTPEQSAASASSATMAEPALAASDSIVPPVLAPIPTDVIDSYDSVPAEPDWLLSESESATRVQEPELMANLADVDMPSAVAQLPLTPDGSFRPVINPATTSSVKDVGVKKPMLLVALVVGLAIVIGAVWWILADSNGQSAATGASAAAAASDSTLSAQTKADSCFEVANQYFFGTNGMPKDFKMAATWYQKAAELGNSDGQSFLGYMYQSGLGVDKDLSKALAWFQKSADQGNSDGQRYMGVSYYMGLGVPKDFKQAKDWFQKSADQSNPEAQVSLGIMYEKGEEVAQNYGEAMKWYMRAANQNLPRAQYYVGTMYQWGQGVAQSNSKAIQWYKQAAKNGNYEAQVALKQLRQTW